MMLLLLWAARRRRGFDPRRAARTRGVVRVLFFGATIALLLGLGTARASVSHASEASMALGRELSSLTGAAGETNRIVLNGERISIGRASSADDVEATLEAFVARSCPSSSNDELGTFRRMTSKDEGVVFCLPRLSEGPRAAAGALARFAESGDLADLGGVSYAYARREADGTTSLLVAWSDGPFRPGRVAWDGEGDAPGSDSMELPRPRGSRRLLTAHIEGAPYALRVYEVADATAALDGYEAEMTARGWTRIDDATGALVFMKGDVYAFVSSSQAPSKTVLTLGEVAENDPGVVPIGTNIRHGQPPVRK